MTVSTLDPRLYNRLVGMLTAKSARAPNLTATLDLWPALADALYSTATKDLSAGAGTFTIYETVGSNTLWHVTRVWKQSTVAATRVRVAHTVRGIASGAAAGPYRMSPSNANEEVYATDVWLQEGDSIGLDTTGNVGDSSIRLDWAGRAWRTST